MAKTKADNPTVPEYLEKLSSPMKPLLLELRQTIMGTANDLREDVKWGNCLTFSLNGKNIIQTVLGKDKVTLIFFEGVNLKDPMRLLQGEGKKVRSARFTAGFNKSALQALVRAAAKIAGS